LGFGGGNLFASRFLLSSTGFFPSYFAIEDAIQFWINTGPEKIFTTLNERQVFLKKQMQKVSELELVTPNYPELSGPLFSYALPDRLADMGFSLFETLEKKHGLIVGVPLVNGRMHLRLSPHIYNTEAEIEKAVDILSAFVRH
jgi:selenocysteine lyase/cysteine desulfurase